MSAFILSTLEALRESAIVLMPKGIELYERLDKNASGDVSLRADMACEEIFHKHLREFGTIHSEESGIMQGKGEDIIYLDPLDGSDNFSSQIPYYGASIALCNKHGSVKSAIVANFCSKDVFIRDSSCALRGNMDSELSSFSQLSLTQKSNKLGIFEGAYRDSRLAESLHSKKLKFRSLGAIALSLSCAHSVNFVLIAGKLRDHDIKAGLHIASDLFIHKDEKRLLISHDETIFNNILKLITTKG